MNTKKSFFKNFWKAILLLLILVGGLFFVNQVKAKDIIFEGNIDLQDQFKIINITSDTTAGTDVATIDYVDSAFDALVAGGESSVWGCLTTDGDVCVSGNNTISPNDGENWKVAIGYNPASNPAAALDVEGDVEIGGTITVNDFICSDCLGLSQIEDIYVLNTSDTMTGYLGFSDKGSGSNQLIKMGGNQLGGIYQISDRGGLMLTSADDTLILADGDTGRYFGGNINPDGENTYILSDGNFYVKTDLQEGWGTEHTLRFSNAGILAVNENTVWHAGNDGSGSGLDADLLDSVSSGSFLRSDTTDNYTSGTLTFNSGTELDMASGSTLDIHGTLSLDSNSNKTLKNYFKTDDTESFINIDDNMTIEEIAEALGRGTTTTGMTKVDDPTAPAPGAFQVSGYQSIDNVGPYWKVDQDSEYIFETWIKVVSSTSTPQRFYAGWTMYDASKVSFGNAQRYWGSPGTEYDSNSFNDGQWHHILARISGVGSSYGNFINGTEYARIVLLFNYSSGDTVTRYAGMKLYKSKKVFSSIYVKDGSHSTVDSDGKLIVDYNGNVYANDLTASGDLRADNFLVDVASPLNDAALTMNDASRYVWTPASGWGVYWNTSANTVGYYGSGVERGYIDLDNGNLQMDGTGYFAGTVTVATPTASGHAVTKEYVDGLGGGDVYGPASATDNAIARFDGTTGKMIQNSAVTIDDSNANIRSDSAFGFLTSGGGAQTGRFKSLQVSTSYSGAIPDQGILFGTDTNLYRGTANILSTDDGLTVAGNVGIGTTIPGAKLQISGGSADWNEATPGTVKGSLHFDPNNSTNNFGNAITFASSDQSNAQAGIYIRGDGGYGTKMYLATTDSYSVGAKTRLMINSNGSVGIGTTNPQATLHVEGFARGNYLTPTDNYHFATKKYVDDAGDGYIGDIQSHTAGGTLNMDNNLITNIGNSGTDFTSGGGLTLAGIFNAQNKRSNFGTSSNWDNVGFSNLTNVHFQGHNQFWIGAGNSTWYTGSGTSYNHDLLITTMPSDSTYTRGVTFAVDSSGAGNNGWRLGRWLSGTNSATSEFIIDGSVGIGGYINGSFAGHTSAKESYNIVYDNFDGYTHGTLVNDSAGWSEVGTAVWTWENGKMRSNSPNGDWTHLVTSPYNIQVDSYSIEIDIEEPDSCCETYRVYFGDGYYIWYGYNNFILYSGGSSSVVAPTESGYRHIRIEVSPNIITAILYSNSGAEPLVVSDTSPDYSTQGVIKFNTENTGWFDNLRVDAIGTISKESIPQTYDITKLTHTDNIGVGTTTPSYKLDVNGTGQFTGALIVATPTASNHAVTKEYVDGLGGGDVYGPASATDNAIARFNTTTGKLIQNSAVTIDDGNANIRSDSAFGFLTSGGGAQTGRFKSLQVSTSYSGTIPDQGILFGTDTNLYRGAANVLSTDDGLTVAGNVGIGTTIPGAKLQINGGSADWNEATPGTVKGSLHFDPNNSTNNFGNAITFASSDHSNAQAGIYIRGDGGYGTKMYLATTDSYSVGAKTRLMINSNGSVGIGTATPQATLHVQGFARGNYLTPTDNYHFATKGYVDGMDALPVGSSGNTLRHNGSDWIANDFLYNDGSYIGIGLGTVAPAATLDVNGGIQATDITAIETVDAPVMTATETLTVGSGNSGDILDVNADLYVRKGVGVGTTAPTGGIHIKNDNGLKVEASANTYAGRLSTTGPTSGLVLNAESDMPLVFKTNNTERARILGGTETAFGIGTATPQATLHVQGFARGNYLTPTDNYHFATKGYVDDEIGAGGADGYIGDVQEHIAGGNLIMRGVYLNVDRSQATDSGIQWYSSGYNAWADYMAPSGAGMGPKGNLTAPSGSLVSGWALRSFIENASGYGWTFESGTSSDTTPDIVAEIRSSDGSMKIGGNFDVAGGEITSANKIKSDTDATFPYIYLDSTGGGDEWTSQGAHISIGESGDLGAASLHMTYVGNGYGYIGSGAVSSGIPGSSYLRFDYDSSNIYSPDNLTLGSDLFVNDFARIDALRVGNTSTDPGDKNIYVEGNATVIGKLTAGEVDPPYSIDGTIYATYGHSTTGLKEETVGKVSLQKAERKKGEKSLYSAELNFDKAEQGSDLWLFREVSAFGEDWNDLVVSLTSEGRAEIWYEFIPKENKLIIYGNQPVKVSYRLIAPRFDWPERDTNLYNQTGEAPEGVGIFIR